MNKKVISGLIVLAGCFTVYPQRSSKSVNIRQVDFNNFTYPFDGGPTKITSSDESSKVDQITYGDLNDDGADEAAVVVAFNFGGNATFSRGYVYTVRNGRVRLLTKFEGGDRAQGSIANIKIDDGFLVVERYAGPSLGEAYYLVTTKHIWNGKRLVQVARPQGRVRN